MDKIVQIPFCIPDINTISKKKLLYSFLPQDHVGVFSALADINQLPASAPAHQAACEEALLAMQEVSHVQLGSLPGNKVGPFTEGRRVLCVCFVVLFSPPLVGFPSLVSVS